MPLSAYNPHAGEILKLEFLQPLGLSQNAVAKAIRVPANRIHAIVQGKRAVTADTDLRLCRFLWLSEGYFLRLQASFDLAEARRHLARALSSIQPFRAAPRKVAKLAVAA
jgi:addiction module HigA family antidote